MRVVAGYSVRRRGSQLVRSTVCNLDFSRRRRLTDPLRGRQSQATRCPMARCAVSRLHIMGREIVRPNVLVNDKPAKKAGVQSRPVTSKDVH